MDDLELSNIPDNSQVIEAMKNSMQQKGKEYKEAELYKDPNWIEASALVYKMKEGKEFNGDVNELAKYGIDKMSEFNYNVSFGMIPDVLDVEDADHDTQVAFAYMMDTYDKKDVTIEGFGRAVKELALDPTSYVGIGTLGAGFAMRKTGAELAKEGIKNRLMSKISSYLTNEIAIGATEGALYTSGDEVARESVYQDAGMMDGYSPENIAIAGGLGAVAGGGIVKGIKMVGKGIDMANKAGEEAMAISAGGGTPPKAQMEASLKMDTLSPSSKEWKQARDTWHKDSHQLTRSEDGTPKVFYHGTNADFNTFDLSKSGESSKAKPSDLGIWSTDSKDYASWHGDNIMELHIKLKNPKIYTKDDFASKIKSTDFKQLRKLLMDDGYDGVIVKGGEENFAGQKVVNPDNIVSFNPEQIKSIHNRGTFDETNPNILKGVAGAGAIGAYSQNDEKETK